MYLYSRSTGCCYLKSVHGDNIPQDAIIIQQDVYESVIANPTVGLVRGHNADGVPILTNPPKPSKEEIVQSIAQKRYEREVAGVFWMGFLIATDRDSQAKLYAEDMAITRSLRIDGSGWKCVDTATGNIIFRPTTNIEIQEITSAVYNYVSMCFRREAELLTALEGGTYTETMLGTNWPSVEVV